MPSPSPRSSFVASVSFSTCAMLAESIGPPYLRSSPEMPSGPGDLLFLRLLSAVVTSFGLIGCVSGVGFAGVALFVLLLLFSSIVWLLLF